MAGLNERIKLLNVGDILQHRERVRDDFIGGFINFFTLGNRKNKDGHCHTARYLGFWDGKHWKAEAHFGAKYGPVAIKPKEWEIIDIYRLYAFKDGLTPEQEAIYMRVTKRFYGRKYDTLGLVGTLRSTVGKLLGWSGLRKSNPWLNNAKDLFCSEAEATITTEMCHEPDWIWEMVDVAPKVIDQATTPNDITRSASVFLVSPAA